MIKPSTPSRLRCEYLDYQEHNREFGDDTTNGKYEVLSILSISPDSFDYVEQPIRIKCNGEIIYFEERGDQTFYNAIKDNRKTACLCYTEDETDFFREKYFEVML